MSNGKTTAILRYPPELDGELHIELERIDVAKGFDFVVITMKVATTTKGETMRDVVRRVGREMAEKPLTIVREV
jgi:hypothetical protein